MRRSTLTRQAPIRRASKRDPVTPELFEAVLRRDGQCVLAAFGEHVCRDRWGRPHDPTVMGLLTIEHVKDELAMGVRAPSDLAHLVALCYGANLKPPSKDERAFLRDYLGRLP